PEGASDDRSGDVAMRQVLLDTSAYSLFKRNSESAVKAIQTAEEVRMSPIVLGELRSGFAGGSSQTRNESELTEFLRRPRVETVLIDEEPSRFYAKISNGLKRAGEPIPTNDIWIAATAMQHGLIVLTADGHFERIPQIIVSRLP